MTQAALYLTSLVAGQTFDFFLIIKPNRCTNFSNLFLEWNSTCFGQFLCPSSWVFHCTYSNGICHTGLLTACEQDQDGTEFCPDPACKLCVQWKTPDDGQTNCPKHAEFYSKNKFEKLVHLVGFIIRIYHDARSPERQIPLHRIQYISSTLPEGVRVCSLQCQKIAWLVR
jgi:hypothetical protein